MDHQSDHWNNVLANQAFQTLWVKHSSKYGWTSNTAIQRNRAGLTGIGPRDELEEMIAAQLFGRTQCRDGVLSACHARRTELRGARENLSQANKLSRTYALLQDALNRHRGKGQQKVTVEHVHVNAGGQAIVGVVPSQEVDSKKSDEQMNKLMCPETFPMNRRLRCGARTRSGSRADRQRYVENAAVGCVEERLATVLPWISGARRLPAFVRPGTAGSPA